MSTATGFGGIRSALSHRNFALYSLGNSLFLIGFWVYRLSVGWLTWELTESGFWLGVVAFADLFPLVILAPLGGLLTDRFDRRRLILLCQCLAIIPSLALFVLLELQAARIEWVVALAAVNGVIASVVQPVKAVLVPSLVPRQHMVTAVALSSVVFNVAQFVGPAIGGVLLAGAGTEFAFLAVILAYTGFALILNLIKLRSTPSEDHRAQNMAHAAWEGLKFTARHPAVGPLMFLQVSSGLLVRPVTELFPGFADSLFNAGARGLAVMTASVGLGALLGGLWVAQRGRVVGLAKLAIYSRLLASILLLAFCASGDLWLAAPLLVLFGACQTVGGTSAQTLIHASVEERLKGRVLSLLLSGARGGPALGAFGLGWAASHFDFVTPVVVASFAFMILTAGIVVPARRTMRSYFEAEHRLARLRP